MVKSLGSTLISLPISFATLILFFSYEDSFITSAIWTFIKESISLILLILIASCICFDRSIRNEYILDCCAKILISLLASIKTLLYLLLLLSIMLLAISSGDILYSPF